MIGGAAAVALLISIWFFRHKKSKVRSARSYLGDDTGRVHEKDANTRAPDRNELDGVVRYEVPDSRKAVIAAAELP